MLPLLIPIIAGAVIGAATNRKKPLQGAAIGAAAGATGGGLLGAGAAAGAGGAAAGGASAAGAGASAGAATGAAGASTAGAAGAGTAAGTAGTAGTAAQSGGLLSTMGQQAGQFASTAKPFLNAASTGITAAGLLSGGQGQQQAPQMAPMTSGGPQSLEQLAQGAQDPLLARRQQMMAQHRTMWG